jgi:carbon-monoxide dehydrogenase large subunit
MTASTASGFIGHRITRLEDARLLRGQGRFVDDIPLPGLLDAAFLRATLAHARIKRIDLAHARAAPDVRAVLTYADLRPLLTSDRIPLALPSAAIRFDVDPPCLAAGEVCHVGEPIALVIAATRALAEDPSAGSRSNTIRSPRCSIPAPDLRPARPRPGSIVPTICWPGI